MKDNNLTLQKQRDNVIRVIAIWEGKRAMCIDKDWKSTEAKIGALMLIEGTLLRLESKLNRITLEILWDLEYVEER